MKLSLAWIFDHIDADWRNVNIESLVELFNKKVAEIEGYALLSWDLKNFAFAVRKGNNFFIPEWNQDITLTRSDLDLYADQADCAYLVKKNDDAVAWATYSDFDVERDELLPVFKVSASDLSGSWKKNIEAQDIIFDIDNVCITHRPDMWGHRGYAREIAAILNLPFKNIKEMTSRLNITEFETKTKDGSDTPFSIRIDAPKECSRFVGAYFSSINNGPSLVVPAMRLLKLGAKLNGGIVDLTNYLMHDWSQPVHAYDADKLPSREIIVRLASPGEALDLLGGAKIELTSEDLLIASPDKGLCLAGIKGGIDSGVSPETKSVFFEAATFDPAAVRKTAQRYDVRTDSSVRFEKKLSPSQPLEAVSRFVKLAQDLGFNPVIEGSVSVVGPKVEEHIIYVSQEFLQSRSGLPLMPKDIVEPLEKIGFFVRSEETEIGLMFAITIPHYRATKDVVLKEDIVEEVVRFYGLDRITAALPALSKKPEDLAPLLRNRAAKRHLAFGCNMIEQRNYPFYDETFIRTLGLSFEDTWEMISPVTEHYKRLIKSLVPGLLKNVHDNIVEYDNLKFFEAGACWDELALGGTEHRKLAGMIFSKRKSYDFYDGKEVVQDLIRAVCDGVVEWKKSDTQICPWLDRYQAATLWLGDEQVGYAGKVDPQILKKMDALPESEAFVFELMAEKIFNLKKQIVHYDPISKYQVNYFDVSLMVPPSASVKTFYDAFAKADQLVQNVALTDRFSKEEWAGQSALTFRIWVVRHDRTMTKEEITAIRDTVVGVATSLGAQVRE